MAYPIELEGSRIIIREWRPDELDGMHRWLSDPVVNRYLSWGTRTRQASEDHLRVTIEAQQVSPREKFYLAVELLSSPGKTIGDTGFSWIDDGVAEIGYFLEPAYWGCGYATEAAEIIIDLAFEKGAQLVIASCDPRNTASEAVMKRCGMKKRESDITTRLFFGLER